MCGMDSREIRNCNYAIIGWIILLGFFALVSWVVVPEPTAQTGSDFQWYFSSFLYFFSASAQTMGALIAIVLTAIYALVTAMRPADNPALEPTKRLMFRDPYLLGAVYLSLGSIITALFGVLYVYTAGIVFFFLPFVAVVVVLLGIGGIGCLLWFLFKRGPLYINPMGLIREDVYDGKDALISNICKIDPARSINYAEICLLLQAKHRGTQYTKHTLNIINKYYFNLEQWATISAIPDELSQAYDKFAYNVTQDLPLLNTQNKEEMSAFFSEIIKIINSNILWEFIINSSIENDESMSRLEFSNLYIKLFKALLRSFEEDYSQEAILECVDKIKYPLRFFSTIMYDTNQYESKYFILWTDFVVYLMGEFKNLYWVTNTNFIGGIIYQLDIPKPEYTLQNDVYMIIYNIVNISWKDINRSIEFVICDKEKNYNKFKDNIRNTKLLFDKINDLPISKHEIIDVLTEPEKRDMSIISYLRCPRIARTILNLSIKNDTLTSSSMERFEYDFKHYYKTSKNIEENIITNISYQIECFNKTKKTNTLIESIIFGFNYPLKSANKLFKNIFNKDVIQIKNKILNYAQNNNLMMDYVTYGLAIREIVNEKNPEFSELSY